MNLLLSLFIKYKNYDRILIYNISGELYANNQTKCGLSIETYEFLAGKIELYTLIDEGLAQVKEGRVKPMKGTIKSIREKINK